MLGIGLALLAALTYALSAVFVGKRLGESNFFSVALVITVTGNIILWPLALLFTNLRAVSPEGVLFFTIAGIVAPGIVRLLYLKGVEVLGVSLNASISATYPLYTSIFAVLFLGEALTPGNWVGIICIVVGVVFIERILSNPKIGPEGISKKGLVFPLLAALILAFSYVLRKHTLTIYNEPLLGVAIGYSSSFLLYLLLSTVSNDTRSSTLSRKDFRLFWKLGAVMSLAYVFTFYALSYERVSIVTPLVQTEPLFVLFFAYLYIRKIERISSKLIISTLLIVTGAMLASSS